jgi:ligand-binding sensor domain-containing protein
MITNNASGHLFAGTTTGGVFRSTDNGDTWTQINTGLNSAYIIMGLTVNKSGHVFAASYGGGIYRSTDNGTSWAQMNTSLKDTSANCFALHPNGNIYAGTNKGGVVKSGSATAIAMINGSIPVSFALFQNYPNPFNPTTTIIFSIPAHQAGEAEVQAVSLKIYDLVGKEVATLVNESMKPGTYRAAWNASGYASGVYYYQLYANQSCMTKKLIIIK